MGTNRSLQTSLARLSSGLRINSAKDDAAGLAISDKMTAQIRGMNQAVRNANDAISLAQTAEGSMQEMTNLLQRMRELAVQSANDTYGTTERQSLDDEYQALATEITRISNTAEFNGTKVLDGSTPSLTFQVGANSGADNQIVFTMPTAMDAPSLMGAVGDITTQANSLTAIDAVDTALATVDSNRGDLGAIQSRLESTVSNLMNISENVSAAKSQIMDADFASETANLTRAQILQQAGVAMLKQANAIPQAALALLQ